MKHSREKLCRVRLGKCYPVKALNTACMAPSTRLLAALVRLMEGTGRHTSQCCLGEVDGGHRRTHTRTHTYPPTPPHPMVQYIGHDRS
eukprot:735025-Pelagomonas_calceolata.AAC.3